MNNSVYPALLAGSRLLAKYGLWQLFEPGPIFGIHRHRTSKGRFLRQIVRCGIFRRPGIFSREITGHRSGLMLSFLDGIAWPKWIEGIGIGVQREFLASHQILFEK